MFAGTGERVGVIFSADAIARRIGELAVSIAAAGLDRLLIVSILNGSFVFAADLMRALHRAGLAPEIDFLSLASYRAATRSSGHIEVLRDLESEVKARNVLLVDDILES